MQADTYASLLAARHLLNFASSCTLNPNILGSYRSAFNAAAAVLTLPVTAAASLASASAPGGFPARPSPRYPALPGIDALLGGVSWPFGGIICG